jgi:hypothetical protein
MKIIFSHFFHLITAIPITDATVRLLPNASHLAAFHFDSTDWSNFEIGDMDFWRGPAYTAFFEHLDMNGGFYYEVR